MMRDGSRSLINAGDCNEWLALWEEQYNEQARRLEDEWDQLWE